MDQIREVEVIVNIFLQSLGGGLQSVMKIITMLGDEIFFILVMPAIYWCIDAAMGVRVGAMLMLSGTFNSFFKILLRGPRPYWISDQVKPGVHETSFGIPSGHAMNAASIWGWLAYEIRKRWTTIFFLLIIFLIGFSRLVMGAHFLTDVLLGWLLGGILVLVFALCYKRVLAWIKKYNTGMRILLAFVTSLVIILLSLGARAINPGWTMPADWAARAGEVHPLSLNGATTMAGVWFGFLTGFAWLLKAKGMLDSKGYWWKRLLRLAIGLAGVMVLYLGLGAIFPDEPELLGLVLRYIRYGLIGFWVAMGAPLVFKGLKLSEFKDVPDRG